MNLNAPLPFALYDGPDDHNEDLYFLIEQSESRRTGSVLKVQVPQVHCMASRARSSVFFHPVRRDIEVVRRLIRRD